MVKQIALTGKRGEGKFALVDDEDYERCSKHSWYLSNNDYCKSMVQGRQVLLHIFIMNYPEYMLDHKNRNKSDCRKENLRPANKQQNGANSNKTKKKTTSKYKGIFFHKNNNVWCAQIKVNYKSTHIGCFKNEIDAAKAYDKKALEAFGEYAHLNFPEDINETQSTSTN